jgi:hypothetical protein
VQRLGKLDQTVVIVSPPRHEESAVKVLPPLEDSVRFQYSRAEPNSPPLFAFTRTVLASELTDSVTDTPCFKGLLPEIERLLNMNAHERPFWDGIVF